MGGWHELARQYEQRHFPPTRRLDLQAEGPDTARVRALQWIQYWAHELPGAELLLVIERGRRPGRRPSAMRRSIEDLVEGLTGGLLEWWQEFGDGSLAVRIARDPRMRVPPTDEADVFDPEDDGRTPETAGVVTLDATDDIPDDLLPLAERAAELRREREGISVGLVGVVLRQIWISAQATAMSERLTFEAALRRLLEAEEARAYGDA